MNDKNRAVHNVRKMSFRTQTDSHVPFIKMPMEYDKTFNAGQQVLTTETVNEPFLKFL